MDEEQPLAASAAPSPDEWANPPESPTLPSDEVHVWRSSLDQPASRLQSLRALLSEDEKARAARFHFEKDRAHFAVARGLLRTILGQYLRTDPARLRFAYNAQGKPSLAAESDQQPHASSLRFNLSHSHGLALYAFTLAREIGLDLEYMRADFAGEEIARRFFSRREVEELCGLPRELRTEAFFNCWTRKEAYIKAVGCGLSMPLDQFDVSLAPGEPAALLRTALDESEAARWSLRALEVGQGYAAAVAVEGDGWRLRCWNWTS